MEKYYYSDELKVLYTSTRKQPFFVQVPKMKYISFIGSGHPGENGFQEACDTLFTLSYIIKFKIARVKKGIDYKVNPLEVSWYLDKSGAKIHFDWKAMIMQPEFINEEEYQLALELSQSSDKKLRLDTTSFEAIDFGRCIQCFHAGDYNMMNDTMRKMQDYAKEHGLNFDLYTHDIYLNDSRKTKTENLKSIMRIGVD